VYWLIDQDTTPATVDYYVNNRRRLTHYSIMIDDAKLVGYSVKNPITGHNYAYRMRFKKDVAEMGEFAMKASWWIGFGVTGTSSAYLYKTRGGKVMAAVLGASVLATEASSWYFTTYVDWVAKYKTQENVLQHALHVRQQGEKHPDYNHFLALVKTFEPSGDINGDLEWAVGAYFNMRIVDKVGALQGISVVSAAVSAATIFTHWQRGGRKLGWGWWLLALGAHYNTADNIIGWVIEDGTTAITARHDLHLAGFLVGLGLAWVMK
jgi:hypothetical protein